MHNSHGYNGAVLYVLYNEHIIILMHNSHALTITNNNGENVLHITKHRNHHEPVFTWLKYQPPTTNRVLGPGCNMCRLQDLLPDGGVPCGPRITLRSIRLVSQSIQSEHIEGEMGDSHCDMTFWPIPISTKHLGNSILFGRLPSLPNSVVQTTFCLIV